MIQANQNPLESWKRRQAFLLALICLMAGIVGGWSFRAARSLASTPAAQAATVAPLRVMRASSAPEKPSPAQLKNMADAKVASLIDQIRGNPNDAQLLTNIGNIYYDAQQYPAAINYYGRALKVKPFDAAVRTDMATADWYLGNADVAIAEFNQALVFAPTNPNALFNRGLVKWQGKQDAPGAIADWKKLLATNPHYEQKAKVEQMLADLARSSGASI